MRILIPITSWVVGMLILLLNLNWLLAIGVWLSFVGVTFSLFIVIVPEITGLVALNIFTGKLTVFEQGLRFKFPWEQVKKENFFSLQLVTKNHKETYAAVDGPMMLVKWSYQYRPDKNGLKQYITVNETTIDEGFTDVMSSILSSIIGNKKAEDARTNVKEIEKKALEIFQDKNAIKLKNGEKLSFIGKLERDYGINVKLIAIADIDFSEDYQQARSGQARAEALAKAAQTIQNISGITGKEAINVILLEQGKSTKKNIFEAEGLTPTIDAVINLLNKKKGGN